MIPDIDIFTEEIDETEQPDLTYGVISYLNADDRIIGYVEDRDAIEQSIHFILNTERYEFPIYSWDYGIELVDLLGQPMPYVRSEVERRVEEALTQDDRIDSVKDFTFDEDKNKLYVTFVAVTTAGDIEAELEVVV